MAKVVVKFDERILKEYGLENEVTIGRLPDNTVLIDNPAVSGHHARIIRDASAPVEERVLPTLGTSYLDTKAPRELLNRLRQERATKAAPSAPKPEAGSATPVVRVLAGASTHAEYKLEAAPSLIGKSDTAVIRLRGWFKPKTAAAIVREGDRFLLRCRQRRS